MFACIQLPQKGQSMFITKLNNLKCRQYVGLGVHEMDNPPTRCGKPATHILSVKGEGSLPTGAVCIDHARRAAEHQGIDFNE